MTRAMNAAPAMLEARAISKHFGGNKVFTDLSITLGRAEILGVIGPNGAGKTTLINVLSGQLPATSGAVLLNGAPVTGTSFQTRSHMGLVRTFQQTKTFRSASVAENLERARLFSRKAFMLDNPTIRGLLDHAGLSRRMEQISDTLPYGMQKMLGLMMAIVTTPKVLMLDEPAAGLERDERHFIDAYVGAAMREIGACVLLVEHDMDLVKRLCPRLCVLDGGRLIAEGATQEVLSRREVIEAYLGASDDEEIPAHA
ncbi:ABC transporter ATP-binding protein [Xanthobacter sp. TB0136]|uniref:ABC transporter ATP-binding protein n=1 Tax=Xanthobacter sp. TB0136 TaxID=3459177 RepID=UPI004039E415